MNSTIVSNLTRAIYDRETVTIGGGQFTANELQSVVAALECVEAIHGLLDGKEHDPDALAAIADTLREAGYEVRDLEDMQPVECQNCDWKGTMGELEPVEDIAQRVAAGEPMPAGECPKCHALAHPVEAAE